VAGIADVVVNLRGLQARMPFAAAAAAEAMGGLMVAETMRTLSATSHARGTPTPSAPGQPPALITGTLSRSVTADPVKPLSETQFMVQVGATTVYARIQELGGQCGRGHATTLPPRPYLAPTVQRISPALGQVAVAAAAAILGG
jgi:phage gpG-like protein